MGELINTLLISFKFICSGMFIFAINKELGTIKYDTEIQGALFRVVHFRFLCSHDHPGACVFLRAQKNHLSHLHLHLHVLNETITSYLSTRFVLTARIL